MCVSLRDYFYFIYLWKAKHKDTFNKLYFLFMIQSYLLFCCNRQISTIFPFNLCLSRCSEPDSIQHYTSNHPSPVNYHFLDNTILTYNKNTRDYGPTTLIVPILLQFELITFNWHCLTIALIKKSYSYMQKYSFHYFLWCYSLWSTKIRQCI